MWLFLVACGEPKGQVRYAPASLVPVEIAETSSGSNTDTTPSTDTSSGTPSSGTTGTETTGTGTDSTSEPTGTTTGSTGTAVTQACYPGPTGAYDVCLDVVELSPVPSDYAYPAPLGGDPQYSAPIRYLDLAAIDPGTELAPNFVLSEFAEEYKGQWGVVQVHAVEHAQDMRDDLGPLIVNSGYRSPGYNAGIGGASASRHMYGDGMDLDPVNVTLNTLVDACNYNGAGYVELYTTHVHCDWRDDPLDPAFYDVSSFASRPAPKPGLPPVEILERGAVLEAASEDWEEGEPMREWTAFDAAGNVIDTGIGRHYTPPDDAYEVEVWVGRQLKVRKSLP